jgi:hypothetical protein
MIASTSWGTLAKLPGRIACRLKSRKKRSTRFIQDEPDGVKCTQSAGDVPASALRRAAGLESERNQAAPHAYL